VQSIKARSQKFSSGLGSGQISGTRRENNMCKNIDVQAMKDDIIMKVKYFDAGKALGIVGAAMESFKPKAIKAKVENLFDEDLQFKLAGHLRVVKDFGYWAVTRFQGIF
jgi:hypothetical protein